ncbi:flippase [Natronosalvus halobius]|uniref:flippase n=1 Tax=Natronosalvus halobius TaxID=2953746 RepID=UPI00209D689F|nr:flippase [Natronosalvus halobius]USZ71469.1 flippase [Natronosalvus halobius]
MNRSLSFAISAVFSARIFIIVVGALITPLLTRLLGPSSYGQYATILSIFLLVKILMVSGIRSGTKKYLSEERSIPNWKNHVLSTYLHISIIFGSLFAFGLATLSASGIIAITFGESYILLFYLLSILALITQFRNLLVSALMGLQLEKYSEPIKIFEKATFGIVAITLTAIGFGVPGVIIGHIISVGLALLICSVIVHNQIDLSKITDPIPKEFPKRELWKFNYSSVLFAFLLYSLYHVDVILLQIFTGEETVGYYKAALVIVELLWVIPRSIQSVLIQSVSEYWRLGSIYKINELSSKITKYVSLITILLAVGLMVLAEAFMPFYFGDSYSPATTPLLILLPGTICFAVIRPSLAITHAKGDMRLLITGTGIAAGINIILNMLLIPPYGMVGAAVATTLGYSSLLITQLLSARSIGYNPFSGTQPVRVIITGILTGIVLFVVQYNITSPIHKLIIIPPLGGVLFTLIAIGLGIITWEKIRTTWTMIFTD